MKKILLNLFLLLLTACLTTGLIQYADPTRPTEYNSSGRATTWVVTEIKNGPDHHKVALVNDQLVKVGDKLGDFTISTISENTVELIDVEKNKETLNLVVKVKNPHKQEDRK